MLENLLETFQKNMTRSRSSSPTEVHKRHSKSKKFKNHERRSSRHRSRSRDSERRSRRRSHERSSKYRRSRSPSEERIDIFGRAVSRRNTLEVKMRKEEEELKSAIEKQRLIQKKELEERMIEERASKRLDELVERRVEEELEKRKDEIEKEVKICLKIFLSKSFGCS